MSGWKFPLIQGQLSPRQRCAMLAVTGEVILIQSRREIVATARTFEEWLSAPVGCTSRDPRFEIRRATPNDFEQIFDLIDTVSQTKRARAVYEWLYYANPLGTARCWPVIERKTGQVVASGSRFPWPVARVNERIEGEFSGDFVTLPRHQRQGIFQLSCEVRDSHAWQNQIITLGAPNAKSRGALAKLGRQHTILGPFPLASLLLDTVDYLRSRSWPRGVARMIGGATNLALDSWQRIVLASPSNVRIEEVRQFDSGIDKLTFECMNASGYWFPHESEFLNWRYFQHPVNSYIARVALVDELVKGYSVVRIDGQRATVMDFTASTAPKALASVLLHATIGAVREAGCSWINLYATSGWRFWKLFHRAGFLNRKSKIYRTARCPDRADVSREENWQLLPGDSDVL